MKFIYTKVTIPSDKLQLGMDWCLNNLGCKSSFSKGSWFYRSFSRQDILYEIAPDGNSTIIRSSGRVYVYRTSFYFRDAKYATLFSLTMA